jgi:hypothetical protein
MLASVPLWALLQQYMLLVFVGRRVELIIEDRGKSRLVIAALFAFLHLPNPALTVACALGGYVWAREYERSPNLLANALTHHTYNRERLAGKHSARLGAKEYGSRL